MVSSKGRVVGGIRILDESKGYTNAERDFKGYGNDCRRMAKFSRTALVDSSINSKLQTDLKNDKMKSGRIALGDIGNLTNRRSQQFTSQQSSKPKLTSSKDKVNVTKKMASKGIEMPQAYPRLSLAKGIMIADLSLTKATRGNFEITGRLQFPPRRRRTCETHVSKANKNEVRTLGSEVSKVQAGKHPQTRFVVGTKKVAEMVTTRKSFVGKFESSAQISGKLKYLARRSATCETHLSKVNQIELATFGSSVSKIQVGKLPQTRFVMGTKHVAKKAATTEKYSVERFKCSAQISGRFKLPGRTACETHISKRNQIELPSFGSDVGKFQSGRLPQPRFVLGTKKVAKLAVPTRKSAMMNSKPRRSAITKQTSIITKVEITKHSGDKEREEQGTCNNFENSKISQDCILQSNGSNFLNDVIKKELTSGSKCNRRKSYTLSLVLQKGCEGSASNEMLVNVDNFTNPLEVADYVDDIYQHYWIMEVEIPSMANYMEIQSEITPKMRNILVNWLIEVHHKYELMEESLFLMIELLNKFISIVSIKKKELQLFGLTALLLASKYEDYWHPKVGELISLAVNQYTKDEMLGTEMLMLTKLQFRLNMPTPYVFMLRFLKAGKADKKLEDLSFYLIELCLVESEALKYKPSLLCASALFVARCSLKLNPRWTGLLRKHARYEESELRNCAEMILRFQRAAATCKPVKYTYKKYLKSDRSWVALLKPMNVLPP